MSNLCKDAKAVVKPLTDALYNSTVNNVSEVFTRVLADDCDIHFTHPFEDMTGPQALYQKVYAPLLAAIPKLERRDYIFMAGEVNDKVWVGCAGFYAGVFEQPWLDIPPTKHVVQMRFHEFYRVEGDKVVEIQALWDIPALMMQANAWPLSPPIGVEWLVPGPATQDGIISAPRDSARSDASAQLVSDMLLGLTNFATGGVEGMQLERYWHPSFYWYGPAGIGTSCGVDGFRHCHQIPFLNAMPDRVGSGGTGDLFGDGDYVGFTAWPGMHMTLSGDGWMGIAPSDKKITMRSLDFWRCEAGLIRENWVLVDLLDVYHQLGVDVFRRMREITLQHR